MNLIEDLNWRYAVKKFTDQPVPEEKVDFILESINLTASSCGLQPYRVFSISDKTLQLELAAGSFNGQIGECSHLLVFASFNDVSTQHVQDMVDLTAKEREMPLESLSPLFNAVDLHFKSCSEEQNRQWAEKQAYIALGTAMVAAASIRVDATPMEGFDRQIFDQVLGLDAEGLHSTVILALGYRDEKNDYLAGSKKVRLPIDKMAKKIGGR